MVFRFLSYLFNLEDWAEAGKLRSDTGVDRQIVQNPVAWDSVLKAIGEAVPARLLKRDLLFVIEQQSVVLDESRIEMLARQHGIRQLRDDGGVKKTLTAYLRKADEGTLSRMLVEASILLASSRSNPTAVLKGAAAIYKVDTEAIAQKVKQEFAAKAKARKQAKPDPKLKNAA